MSSLPAKKVLIQWLVAKITVRNDAKEVISQDEFSTLAVHAEFAFCVSQDVSEINVENLNM
jgi:hypothetical protein